MTFDEIVKSPRGHVFKNPSAIGGTVVLVRKRVVRKHLEEHELMARLDSGLSESRDEIAKLPNAEPGIRPDHESCIVTTPS